MELICSVSGIVDARYPKQGIGDLVSAGIDRVMLEYTVCAPGKQRIDVLWNAAKDKGLKAAAVRFHFAGKTSFVARKPGSIDDHDAETGYNEGELLQESLSVLGLCEESGCKTVLVPPPFQDTEAEDEREKNRAYYLALADHCKDPQTEILLINQCGNVSGHLVRGYFSDASDTVRFVEDLNREAGMERFGLCLDTGCCNICGQNMQEFVIGIGDILRAVLLKDNDGRREMSYLPFVCGMETDWLGLIRGLRQTGFDGQLILDMADTVSAFSPLLRPQLLPLAKSVLEYFTWQVGIENALKKYSSIVLFGAGNMCRNYMKCYGEKYPPLFTCDNNAALWGSDFCGLEVKPPAELKDLPKDCGVFICNIYYREIKAQLRELGVEHIEYFNDEYMPSFYFDRLEREE